MHPVKNACHWLLRSQEEMTAVKAAAVGRGIVPSNSIA